MCFDLQLRKLGVNKEKLFPVYYYLFFFIFYYCCCLFLCKLIHKSWRMNSYLLIEKGRGKKDEQGSQWTGRE